MLGSRRPAATLALAAAAAGALPAIAAADAQVTDRYEAPDGTVFTLSAGSALRGKGRKAKASFRFEARRPSGVPNIYGDGSVEAQRLRLRLAHAEVMIVGSTVACGKPGSSAAYGTAVKRVKRVVATLAGGGKVRLKRHHAPRAWHYDGWVIGAVAAGHRPVLEIAAYDAKGKRITRGVFSRPVDCSQA